MEECEIDIEEACHILAVLFILFDFFSFFFFFFSLPLQWSGRLAAPDAIHPLTEASYGVSDLT